MTAHHLSQSAQTFVLLVMKADGSIALNQLDAVEDATAHIARALKGILAAPKYQNGMFVFFQPIANSRIFVVTKKGAADLGSTDQRHMHVDKCVFRRAFFRTLERARIASFFKS